MLKLLTAILYISTFTAVIADDTPADKDLGAIWCIGDSITQSNADGDDSGSPRKSLHDLLKKNGYSFTFTGHYARNPEGLPFTGEDATNNLFHYHTGVSGFLIGDEKVKKGENGSRGIANYLKKYWETGRIATVKPDLILIMLGTNDIGKGLQLDEAPQRLERLIDMIYALPNVGDPTILLASIPPNRRAESTRTNVLIFNESVPKIAASFNEKGKKVFFVDQFAGIDADYESHMRADNLHPNGKGNDAIANQWFNAIENISKKNTNTREVTDESTFMGYDRYQLKSTKGKFSVIKPKKAAPGKPWIWRSLFWEKLPLVIAADLQLVDQGYHVVIVYGDVAGHPSGNEAIDAAYKLLTEEHGFSKTLSMGAMSRGNLSLFRWASANPEKVESIYIDNGVCNVFSWPAGKNVPGNNSTSKGDKGSWKDFKKKFGFKTDAEALASKESPIDLLEPLAKANVPILMMCGMKDEAVPYAENGAIMKKRYTKLGGSIQILEENIGHRHGLKDPTPVLDFIIKHTPVPATPK